MHTVKGTCHCGKVSFEFDNPISAAMECNCSICHRKGALWHAATDSQFRILSGQEALTLYQFGTRTAKHYFCRHCGVSPFSNPRLAPLMWAVNLRCIDGIDLDSLPKQQFDGRNWEKAAAGFMKARASGAV